mmetsp:Transcript_109638/g.305586  ORF Transcript_109638/g.305586 Transcript_109638/m.305586 type:complete len:83 (-) Transcript_109638:102-350(-)
METVICSGSLAAVQFGGCPSMDGGQFSGGPPERLCHKATAAVSTVQSMMADQTTAQVLRRLHEDRCKVRGAGQSTSTEAVRT